MAIRSILDAREDILTANHDLFEPVRDQASRTAYTWGSKVMKSIQYWNHCIPP